jgi:hypothetical protein
MELTAEIARELLTYNPDTGKLYWKERSEKKYYKNYKISMKKWNLRWAGKEAFTTINYRENGKINGLHGGFFNKDFRAHRIAWLIYYGEWPKNQIDHINQDPTDNRIENLRDVTQLENLKNQALRSNNKSGYIGVHFEKSKQKYRARVQINNNRKHIGYYNTIEEAVAARAVANINYNFHPNHGNSKGKEINA